MTSNHFLFVILYFLSNFFIFIAEASASSDQELKTKFFNDQCQTSCSPEFKACYQKLSDTDRNKIMNELIGRRMVQKLLTVDGVGFYTYGSDVIPAATAKAEFNKAVGSKCQTITVAESKAAQSQVAKSSGLSSSGKSDSGGSSDGGLLDAAKQMAPVLAATPAGKEILDAAKAKGKEVIKGVRDFKWGNANIGKSVNEAIDKTNQQAADSSSAAPSGNYGSVNNSDPYASHLKSNVPQPTAATQSSAPVDSTGQQVAPNYSVNKPTESPTPVGTQQKAAAAVNDPKVQEAAKKLDPSLPGGEAKEAANPASVDTPDAKAATDKAAADKVAQEAQTKLEGAIGQMEAAGGLCAQEVSSIKEAAKKYVVSKQTCGTDAASADNFCDTMRNQKALDVQKMISAGTAVISKATAASESCGIMGNVSTLANGGMLAAQAVCSGYKFKCDFSCGDAKKEIAAVAKLNGQPITSCVSKERARVYELLEAERVNEANMLDGFINQLTAAQNQAAKVIGEETPAVEPHIITCEKHEADILTMGAQAAALLSAAMDSKKCEKQLSSGDGNGSGSGSLATTAQFCAQPGNSSSITCRCAADPSGAGCLGSLGGSNVSGFAGLQKGVGNVSGFSSVAAPKISDSDIQFGDIPSDIAAKTDNGLSPTSPFGTAEATGSGGSAGGSGVAGASKPAGVAGEEEKSKFSMGFSSLAKGFGNLFGLKGNDKGGKSLSKEQKDVQLQAIKRKIASDQVRAEISTASGKSNFDKIKERYTEARGSLISAP